MHDEKHIIMQPTTVRTNILHFEIIVKLKFQFVYILSYQERALIARQFQIDTKTNMDR